MDWKPSCTVALPHSPVVLGQRSAVDRPYAVRSQPEVGYAGGADGFFWMSWEDFCANWDTVLIANLPKAKSTRAAHRS